jgi:predicted nuclease with RNAse H fold
MINDVFTGIDLAALPKNQTGACLYDGSRFECRTLYGDDEILGFIGEHQPRVVAIDAPLTLPRGRCCFDDSCCGTRKIRECDRMLISRGYRVFPPGFSFMKQLTLRGRSLKERLSGHVLIEVHPRTTMRILGLREFPEAHNEHERDACAAALTAFLYAEGKYEELGDDEGTVVIPLTPEKTAIRARSINKDRL